MQDPDWVQWLDASLEHLRSSQLLRVLRPLIATGSAVRAAINEEELHKWISDQKSSAAARQHERADNIATTSPSGVHRQHRGGHCSGEKLCLKGGSARDSTCTGCSAIEGTVSTCSSSDDCKACCADGRQDSTSGGAAATTRAAPSTQQSSIPRHTPAPPAHAPRLRQLLLFSLNDYLGLSCHPSVCAAAADAARRAGNGPRSSALVAGFTSEHRLLEQELAALKGTQDALLFPTGFAANMAVISALATPASPAGVEDSLQQEQVQPQEAQRQRRPQRQPVAQAAPVHIFSDELNHASIIDGARLACRGGGAVLAVYRHSDIAHLAELLATVPAGRRKLVVTDGLFSMDGDFADLRGLASLRARHGFLLVVDDAHATLVCGPRGGGSAEMLGVSGCVDVHVGTLSKAAAGLGGFAACSTKLRSLVLNRGRALVFSTALPLPVVAAARAAIATAAREPWRRQHVWALTRRLAAALSVPAHSPIIPLVVGSEADALAASAALLSRGLHVPAIRPPTVPPGTSRLRVSLSAEHTAADVDALVAALREEGGSLRFEALPHLRGAGPGPHGELHPPARL